MAILQKSAVVPFLLGAVCLTLGACGDSRQQEVTPYEGLSVGRFVVINIPGTREMIQLDTGSGRTWALTWSDDGEGGVDPSGWTALDSDGFPRS